MKVLGYNGGLDGYPAQFNTGHDAAAAIVVDGQVVAACEEERFTREKHTGKFPRNAIEFCLREAGLSSVAELDLVTYYYALPLMWDANKLDDNREGLNTAESALFGASLGAMRAYNRVAGYNHDRSRIGFERLMGTRLAADRYKVVPHHLCHVASAFYESPFSRALCVTLDAEGESVSSLACVADGEDFRVLRETWAPNSLGYLYAFFTSFLGFEPHDEYKVMGLAPYGDASRFRSYFDGIVRNRTDGRFDVDPSVLLRLMARDALFGEAEHYPRSVISALGSARKNSEPVEQRHMDIAASLQEALERVVVEMLRHLRHSTGERNLCLAGGVALNCSMNGKIARSGLFDDIWIHPAAHDSGTAVGAAMYGYHKLLGKPREISTRRSVYLGPGHSDESVVAAVEFHRERVTASKPNDLFKTVAQAIADGKVVGWYHGRMEWGPRALGNRSILADARRDDMKDIVNHAVKMREGFRPFAPACMAEHVGEWFDMTGLKESPHMLYVVPVHETRRKSIPAVTHVDGSARVQTVTKADNARFHKLLAAFYDITGVPLMMNTSFNVKGEPIVNTPMDAVRCFLGTGIDMLVMGDEIVEKRPEVSAADTRARAHARGKSGRVVNGQISAV